MAVLFAREQPTTKMIEELLPLVKRHWEEIAKYKDIALAPGIGEYAKFQSNGMLRYFTVREDEKLIGYAVFFVGPNLHYQGCIQANQDVIFIVPERRGWVGIRFLKWLDVTLAEEGVQLVLHHLKAKEGQNFGKVLERQGYELMDHVYAKRLR
jgi:hypothetical protein